MNRLLINVEAHFSDDVHRRLWSFPIHLAGVPDKNQVVLIAKGQIKVSVSEVTWNDDENGPAAFVRGLGFVMSGKKPTDRLLKSLGGTEISWA